MGPGRTVPGEPVTASLVPAAPAGQGAARPIPGVLATTVAPGGWFMGVGLAPPDMPRLAVAVLPGEPAARPAPATIFVSG
jgi:hypothetical protein